MTNVTMSANKTETVTIIINTAISSAANKTGFTRGYVVVPAAWTAAAMGFKVSDDNSTFTILRTSEGVPVQINTILTNGSRAYDIPDEVMAAKFVQLWSKHATAATETDINQTAARTLYVVLAA